jgi:hypothetical protein
MGISGGFGMTDIWECLRRRSLGCGGEEEGGLDWLCLVRLWVRRKADFSTPRLTMEL